MQSTSGLRSAGKAPSLRHDWSGMHRVDRTLSSPSTTGCRPVGRVCVYVRVCVGVWVGMSCSDYRRSSHHAAPFFKLLFFLPQYHFISPAPHFLQPFSLPVTLTNREDTSILWTQRNIIKATCDQEARRKACTLAPVWLKHTWSVSSGYLSC